MKTNGPKKAPCYRFDFEVGYLVKSPCRECRLRENLPKCIDNCKILDKIHEMLAETVSCSRHRN